MYIYIYKSVSDNLTRQHACAFDNPTDRSGHPGRMRRAALTLMPRGAAEKREDVGLYCPMELQKILESSFTSMDKEVLAWLHGKAPADSNTCLPNMHLAALPGLCIDPCYHVGAGCSSRASQCCNRSCSDAVGGSELPSNCQPRGEGLHGKASTSRQWESMGASFW